MVYPYKATWDYTFNMLHVSYRALTTNYKEIIPFITDCYYHPHLLYTAYRNHNPLYTAVLATVVLIIVHYIAGEVTENYSHVDRAWSITPVLYAWHFTYHDYLQNGSVHPRLLAASVLISIWGARLTYNLARKGGYSLSAQDHRFAYLHKRVGTFGMTFLNFVFIAPVQDILLLMIVSPLYMTNLFSTQHRPSQLSSFDWIIIALHLSFLCIETVADEQQYVFQTEKYALLSHINKSFLKGDYKLGFLCNSGLFRYSRHPNCYAEMCMWWTIYLFSVSTLQEVTDSMAIITFFNWTMIGPFCLTLLFQSSTWLTERISTEKYPEYAIYRKHVSRFIPWFSSSALSR